MNMPLPGGGYTYCFAVDMIMNGSIDLGQEHHDHVDVTVGP
jgi:hypothetical protein